jgi:hypothetical protein
MSEVDRLVDAFVAAVNSRPRDRRLDREVPPSVKVACDEVDLCEWRVVSCEAAPWIEDIERTIPARLPQSYASLISRYCFPVMEVGPIVFHGNTIEGSDYYEFRRRLLSDPHMSPMLLKNGFVQFGKPSNWSYDPVCFDTSSRNSREYPVVRLDHEDILIRNRVKVVEVIAPSLRNILEAFVAAG